MLPRVNFKHTAAYRLLEAHFISISNTHMRELFANDSERFKKFSCLHGNLLFDYSKNRITEDTMHLLVQLAHEVELPSAIEAMFTGETINETEKRAVLHTALRNFSSAELLIDGKNILTGVSDVREKMKQFSHAVISGSLTGYSGKPFTDVVNIGIGGSDLGPNMVAEALKHYKTNLNVHFVSNVDATHLVETLRNLNPETTLFLVASKTFTTQETMLNAHTAKAWFLDRAVDQQYVKKHFIALSTATEEVVKFGIDPEHMFVFWDWVGGRYSLWSAIGLSVCLAIGYDNFEQLLKGAEDADQHFRRMPFEKNIPVLMALLGFWYVEFFHFHTYAVIPYDQYLHRFTAYLQQADMESNGKSVDRNGDGVTYHTGPVIWGEPGTNGQHAFFQLMHQGTEIIPADFIAAANSLYPSGEHHQVLLSNFFAQTEALMQGKTYEVVKAELKEKGMSDDEIRIQAPFRVFEGNRPTNTIFVKQITPFALGQLIACYEHKIFVQGIIWNIFSFDQWGVELGKKLALKILPELKTDMQISSHDSSSNGLINQYKKWSSG